MYIELTDALMRDTRFTRVGGCDVARVDGIVHGADAAVAEAEEEAAAATNAAADAAAEAARAQAPFMLGPMESERDHPAVFLGELRLGDFKQSLEKSGVATEFDAGTLKCGPLVRVAKQNPQHVVFEGALSEEYYKLRQQCRGICSSRRSTIWTAGGTAVGAKAMRSALCTALGCARACR